MIQTKQQWRVRLPREGKMGGVEVLDGDKYICTMSHHPAERQMAKDYAAHIVACVNACTGIPDTALKPGIVMMQEIQAQELIAQRDELLAALVAFREDVSDNRHAELASVDPYSIDQDVLDKIDAAIARAKGGAA